MTQPVDDSQAADLASISMYLRRYGSILKSVRSRVKHEPHIAPAGQAGIRAEHGDPRMSLFTRDEQTVYVDDALVHRTFSAHVHRRDNQVVWSDVGLSANCAVRDLWAHKDLGSAKGGRTCALAPHAAALYKVTPAAR